MNWTVIWLDGPLDELARATAWAWGTPITQSIVRAMAKIEQVLQTDPTQTGESRGGHRRIAFEFPLSIDFEVHPDQRAVIVTRVRYTPLR